jgi:hypothetical protein
VTSGCIPPKDEPGPDEILEALQEAIFENPRLIEVPAEEVARQLVLEGYLQEEPSAALVADMLDALEVVTARDAWGFFEHCDYRTPAQLL